MRPSHPAGSRRLHSSSDDMLVPEESILSCQPRCGNDSSTSRTSAPCACGSRRRGKSCVLSTAGTTGRREDSCLQLGHGGGADPWEASRSFIGAAGHPSCSVRVSAGLWAPMCPSSPQKMGHRGYRMPSPVRDHVHSLCPPPHCGVSVSTPDLGSTAGISRQAPSSH